MEYSHHTTVTSEQFIDVLNRSTLGERRPIGDRDRIALMLKNADLLCTAWDGDRLIGIARSVTDFSYCCYLSDLAVDAAYQKRGIGLALMRLTQEQLPPECKLILLAAPKAEAFYRKVGLSQHPSAWITVASPLLSARRFTHE